MAKKNAKQLKMTAREMLEMKFPGREAVSQGELAEGLRVSRQHLWEMRVKTGIPSGPNNGKMGNMVTLDQAAAWIEKDPKRFLRSLAKAEPWLFRGDGDECDRADPDVPELPDDLDEADPEEVGFWPEDLMPEGVKSDGLGRLVMNKLGEVMFDHFRKDRDLAILAAICDNPLVLAYTPFSFVTRELCVRAVKSQPRALAYVPPDFTDREIVRLAAWDKKNDRPRTASETRAIYLEAVKHNPKVYGFISYGHIDRDISLAAVKADGMMLKYVPKEYMDAELCAEAVNRNIKAFEFVPEDVRSKVFPTVLEGYVPERAAAPKRPAAGMKM